LQGPGGLFLKPDRPCKQSYSRKEGKNMKDNNRVLIRRGARNLSEHEVAQVNGGTPHTTTACTLSAAKTLDGDVFLGEC
jgi:hypothetical protein